MPQTTMSGVTTTIFYYAGNQVLLEKQGETFTGVYTYGNSLLCRNSENPFYDGHGSERTVTASSQSVIGAINFEAFGQTAGSTGSSSSPYVYAGAWGYRTDGDAGLMHVGARYYDAQVGRFITRDTVLSEHPYLYCEHDAVNAVDPSGHITAVPALPFILGGAVIGAGVVGIIDYFDDGKFNRPWWHYGIGAGVGAIVSFGIAAWVLPGGAAIGGIAINIGIHVAHHEFEGIGLRPHIQVIKYLVGVGSSHVIRRIPFVWDWWRHIK